MSIFFQINKEIDIAIRPVTLFIDRTKYTDVVCAVKFDNGTV
jgi:hypothetical protein